MSKTKKIAEALQNLGGKLMFYAYSAIIVGVLLNCFAGKKQ